MTERDCAILYAEKHITEGALILDTETTGLADSDEIVEIAILRIDGQHLLNEIIRPSRPIPADVTAIHGITDADVESARIWPNIWPVVQPLIANRRVITYNAPFDRRMIAQSCGRWPQLIDGGIDAPIGIGTQWICLMDLYQRFAGFSKWVSLKTACENANITPGVHRARSDAEAARQLLHFIANARLEI